MPATARRLLVVTALGFAIVAVVGATMIHSVRPRATVLMYHAVDDGDGAPGVPSIGRALFERQMDVIATRGYETVFVKNVVARYEAKAPVPSHWLALTFDGGYPDFYTNVYLVLAGTG